MIFVGGSTHLILYAILHYQLHDLHWPLLPQTMDPVHRLVFHRRVPPGIHHEHHTCFSQVEGDTTRFEGNEEDGDVCVVHLHVSWKPHIDEWKALLPAEDQGGTY